MDELVELVEGGHEIGPDTVGAVVAALDQAEDIREVFDDVVWRHRGKKIAPKTVNQKRYVDAIRDGLREALRLHPKLVVMGQDIAEYGGVFKVTEGFLEEFGRKRIRNTPIIESGAVGAALAGPLLITAGFLAAAW